MEKVILLFRTTCIQEHSFALPRAYVRIKYLQMDPERLVGLIPGFHGKRDDNSLGILTASARALRNFVGKGQGRRGIPLRSLLALKLNVRNNPLDGDSRLVFFSRSSVVSLRGGKINEGSVWNWLAFAEMQVRMWRRPNEYSPKMKTGPSTEKINLRRRCQVGNKSWVHDRDGGDRVPRVRFFLPKNLN